ncbi:MAG: HEAT repeat domain-containing protein [Planctomycetes bacterium]|nr:HEAT repeat domain-containing protein [Planctomycetota bacterium]
MTTIPQRQGPAEPEPEVLFCNVCNQSVPESAVREGRAVRLPSGVAPALGGAGAAGAARDSALRGAIVVAVVVVLAALVGAALFLESRIARSQQASLDAVVDLQRTVGRQEERLVQFEERFGLVASERGIGEVRRALDATAAEARDETRQVGEAVDALVGKLEELRRTLGEIAAGQVQGQARAALLQDELRAITRDLAELRAMPRVMVAEPSPRPDVSAPAPPVVPEAGGDEALPPQLLHQVGRLGDADAGARFEAVDELLRSGDARVLAHVLPLAKDPDPFVRRLVLEGLGGFRSRESVEALLTALADPEEIVRFTAYASLKAVTGQSLPFDPEAREDQRASMQRRWRRWWDENRDSF